MKRKYLIICIASCCVCLVSCGSFGEGLLAGLTSTGGYGYSSYNGGYNTMAYNGGGNMNYLLNPNYAIAQVVTQQQQNQQVYNSIATKTINEVLDKEEQEYQAFCKSGFKKSDGTSYTKQEWRALVGKSIQDTKKNETTISKQENASRSTGVKSSSSSRICKKLSATDNAHCNGNGKCSRCNGEGKYYDNTLGIPKWVDPCVYCKGSGKCPSCNGTGRKGVNKKTPSGDSKKTAPTFGLGCL